MKKAIKFQKLNSDHIKAGRLAIGWNQQRLADAAGISISTLKRLEELGPENASRVTIDKLVAALAKGGAIDGSAGRCACAGDTDPQKVW
jgi:transcriptional regulator with XRE-family HTH domain